MVEVAAVVAMIVVVAAAVVLRFAVATVVRW